MTICVAAIGKHKDEEIIVFATDKMITVTNIGQFEHSSIKKFKKLNSNPNTFAMLSGNPLIFNDILKGIESGDFDSIKERIHKNMVSFKDTTIHNQILGTYKVDFDYLKEILKGQVLNPYVQGILNTISQFNLNTNILLIGFKNQKAQISEITEFAVADMTDINFGAIGSGGVQALNTLLFQKQSKETELNVTLYNVYKAKRNAEVSVGVGKETDILVLTESNMIKLSEDKIQKLSKIYESELEFGKSHDDLNTIIQI